jgi:hypothetical protein
LFQRGLHPLFAMAHLLPQQQVEGVIHRATKMRRRPNPVA